MEDALKVARGKNYGHHRDIALAAVAERLAEGGRVEDALKVAQGIGYGESRGSTLRALAERLVAAGGQWRRG